MDLRLFDEKQAQREKQNILSDEVVIAGVGKITVPIKVDVETEEKFNLQAAFDKVDQPYSSGAGAGSDFFHIWKKQREREMDRMKKMDADWDVKAKNLEHHEKRLERLEKEEAKTTKKRDKRKRQKDNATQAKKLKQEVAKASNAFANDGSFMATVGAELKEQEEKAKALADERERRREEAKIKGEYVPVAAPVIKKSVEEMAYQGNLTIREIDD
eukprot:GEMP01100773.1.p1 GENE.GEMP01100773.1~~GEMP01100773.1.p1  ORF type:complete len:215 (-),score=80.51 GEMP01100773.1:63-707(-)